MLSKRAENDCFSKMWKMGSRNWENVENEPPVISAPIDFEIPKFLDFVYTNPSQASHLDAKKKT